MPASRITFAIGDLVAEIKRLVPDQESPAVELRLDEPTFMAVVAEIEHHYGDQLVRKEAVLFGDAAVEFGGVRIVTALSDVKFSAGVHEIIFRRPKA